MQQRTLLQGLVTVWTLPQVQPGPAGAELLVKRVMLPQGELAQFHDSEEAMRYIAAIELKTGTVRGNHYHKIKREYVYVLSGRLTLVLQKLDTEVRETIEMSAGDLALIPPGIIHALQVKEDGLAVEFSPNRFDPMDTYRAALI
jgi:mannose-6-phosphate isomerase-like protein (cupin superfamily)